jgi:hypothetical protein
MDTGLNCQREGSIPSILADRWSPFGNSFSVLKDASGPYCSLDNGADAYGIRTRLNAAPTNSLDDLSVRSLVW